MCTVTIFPTPEEPDASISPPRAVAVSTGFRLCANRDEQHDRADATPPTLRRCGPLDALCPTDPQGGGTWIGVNQAGVAATLLNLNLESDPQSDAPRDAANPHDPTKPLQSRGALVPQALAHATARAAADHAERTIVPSAQRPFRLVVADSASVHLLRCDGQSLTREDLGPPSGQFFTSSGLGDHQVDPPRRQHFRSTFEPVERIDARSAYDRQLEFHHHQWADNTPHSIYMMRDDARTVSITSVEVNHGRADVAYTPVDRQGNKDEPHHASLTLINPASAPDPKKKNKKNRGWFRWRYAYLLLLIASWITQAVHIPGPNYGGRHLTIDVPRMTSKGPQNLEDPQRDPVTLSLRRYGNPQAPEVLLALPGSPSMMDNFQHFAPALLDRLSEDDGESQFQVISLDYPGTGKGTRWVPNYGGDACAHYALAALDALDLESVHVLGYSFGGAVATRMVDLAPERVMSMTFFGAIGAQEAEGTGNYSFEHFKYALNYGLFVVAPEFIPHFGLLADRADRNAYARNFWDLDQRPYAEILDQLDQTETIFPILIINGHNDPLVSPNAARLHHELIEHSELVITDGGHGDILFSPGAADIAEIVAPFLSGVVDGSRTATRSTQDPYLALDEAKAASTPTERLGFHDGLNPWLQTGLIAAGTFFSEDLTCIYAGLLANHRQIDFFLAVMGCFLGIFLGDVALFLVGRVAGLRILSWKPVRRWAPTETLEELGSWYERYGLLAVFASRFMPGTRMPLYITAGVVGAKAKKFVLWALISDIIYTPLIVALVAIFGDRIAGPLTSFIGRGWIGLLLTAVLVFLLMRLLIFALTKRGRQRLAVGFTKLTHQEWWPTKIFYLPMVPIWMWLGLKHRSLTAWTAANPAMPDSGLVGESKAKILEAMDHPSVLAWRLIPAGDEPKARRQTLLKAMHEADIQFPVILKPDVGERGAGVRRITNEAQALEYFQVEPLDVMVQAFDEGPMEVGLFYVRHPEDATGHLFAVTDKHFPSITGNGHDPLEQLIWADKRLRLQADLFLHRFHDRRQEILRAGEVLQLAVAGNHCQGTRFTDGAHLITDELSQAIDDIAQSYDGFYFGRFDVRYSTPADLAAGRNLRVIEVNGVSSEATNHYDPSWGPLRTYRQLYRQWDWAFRIGKSNIARGHSAATVRHLVTVGLGLFRSRRGPLLAD